MSEKKFGGSVSQQAMEAAMEELEAKVQGRLGDEEFERVFGTRWSNLKAVGVINNALVGAYGEKASADDDSEGLFDETEQARLILARYDARQAPTPIKRRRKAKTAAAGKDDAAKAGLGDPYARGLVEGQGLGNRSTGDGQGKAAEAGSSPDQLDELEREL